MAEFSKRERQILDILFEASEATALQIREAMTSPPSDATVRTILRILEEKGAVTHRRDGRKFVFRPRKRKSTAGKSAMRRVLDVFYGGSIEDALSAHLMDPKTDLDRETIEKLSRLIAEAEKKNVLSKKTKEN